jgi:hypothetical protein
MVIPALERACLRLVHAHANVDLARTAIALERYHLANGSYPDSLDSLAPKYIPAVPHDVILGKPLHYHRDGQGFVLYSIGWNEKDDNGTLGFYDDKSKGIDISKGDWVWRQ